MGVRSPLATVTVFVYVCKTFSKRSRSHLEFRENAEEILSLCYYSDAMKCIDWCSGLSIALEVRHGHDRIAQPTRPRAQ